MIQFFGYDKCGTCRKAKKVLDSKKIKYQDIDITENPPPKKIIQSILKSGEYTLSDLFNKSGLMYRELNMKEKIKTLKETDLVDLLSKNGRLVKRPIITNGKEATVGFDENRIKKNWL